MLNRAHRLVRSFDFRRVTRNGHKHSTRAMNLYVLPTDAGYARFGILTPKSLGSAPVRNRIKRQLRAAAFTLQDSYSADVVIRVLPEGLALSWHELSEELATLMGRATHDAR